MIANNQLLMWENVKIEYRFFLTSATHTVKFKLIEINLKCLINMTELLYEMNKTFDLFLQVSPVEEPMLPYIEVCALLSLHFQRKLLLTTGNVT